MQKSTWFKRAVVILFSPFVFPLLLMRFISSSFFWKVISSPVRLGGEERRATTWPILPDATLVSLPTLDILEALPRTGGPTGTGGGTGSLWLEDLWVGDLLRFGLRDIVAYSHRTLSLYFLDFNFIYKFYIKSAGKIMQMQFDTYIYRGVECWLFTFIILGYILRAAWQERRRARTTSVITIWDYTVGILYSGIYKLKVKWVKSL